MAQFLRLVSILSAAFAATLAVAAEPTPRILGSRTIWESKAETKSTDLTRFGERWICVVQTDAGLQLIASPNGEQWRPLSTVVASNANFPLHSPRLNVTPTGRLMLTAVEPKAPCGGYSRTWLSKDGVSWKKPKPTAETNYLVSSVRWHKDVAYSFQRGSICGNAMTVRFGASDNAKRFTKQFEETFDDWPHKGALVFDGEQGYCVMGMGREPLGALVGVSKAPYQLWQWKQLAHGVKNPNAIRTNTGTLWVVAGIPGEAGRIDTMICRLHAAAEDSSPHRKQLGPVAGRLPSVAGAPELVPLGKVPVARNCFVGMANDDEHVLLSHHDGSTVRLTRVAFVDR